jgi:hypothetical protein
MHRNTGSWGAENNEFLVPQAPKEIGDILRLAWLTVSGYRATVLVRQIAGLAMTFCDPAQNFLNVASR